MINNNQQAIAYDPRAFIERIASAVEKTTVKRLVSNTLGGIGYIEEGAVGGKVKVLFKS